MEPEKLVETLRRKNRKFNHYITLIPQARQREEGILDSMLIPVKDVIHTKGVRTTVASLVLEKFIPSHSATIVEKIETNGGVVVGKMNTHEFAMGPSTTSQAFSPTRNPNDPELITGGSSGGSAGTVGASDVPAAIGTDIGGSV